MADRTTENAPAQPQPRPAAIPDTATVAQLRAALQGVNEEPTGPNASTDPENPAEHFYLASDGKTKINAYGEEKGSAEDKRRMAALGFA
jgi:hypothetical protein